ncbi:MAG TPA: amino acid deaminase [Terracidiphilus sp.]|nr:amino acid deaminase [Terracidiphilus sp.]
MSVPDSAKAASIGTISPLNKGLGLLASAATRDDIARLGWNLLREDISLPVAVLYADRLEHNLRWMQQFIEAYGMCLAPHGKTTMAPALFRMQLDAGAWGITVATAQQACVAQAHGVRRVLMANELVGRQNMAIIAELLQDPAFDFYCLVDSAEQVEQLGQYFRAAGLRLQVLVELGVERGRTGVRNNDQLTELLSALNKWADALALSGVELYEGVLEDEASIREFLHRAVSVTRRLLADCLFARTPALLSGAGSAWYDVVAEEFSAAGFGAVVEVVLRPGCYLTHDVGAYRTAQARILAHNPIARAMLTGLEPALHVWAYVQSVPEPDRAIIGFGKHDVAFDSGFPTAALHFRPGQTAPVAASEHWAITKMMDQHAYLRIEPGNDLRVGDMLAFDIAHPCLTFDKWRVLPIVNAQFEVVDAVETFF